MARIAAFDIGSSYLKAGIFEVGGNSNVRLLYETRKPHDTALIFKSPSHYAESLEHDIVALLRPAVDKLHPIALGISAYRESVVALDPSGRIFVCGSNNDIDKARRAINRCVARTDTIVSSLPSWLAWKWTGALYCTPSDRHATRQFQSPALGEEWWPMPQSVPVGASIGMSDVLGRDIQVFLGGTDEQLSNLGVGLGVSCDLGISTGTFWSFSWLTDAVVEDPRIRFIPQIPPYPATASLVGYRWGSILDATRQHCEAPFVTAAGVPEWVFGDAARLWLGGKLPTDAVGAIKDDIALVPAIIGRKPALRRAIVCGGGIRCFPEMKSAIAEVFTGIKVEFMRHDATLQGLALLGSCSSVMG